MERRRTHRGRGSVASLLKEFALRDTQPRRLVIEAMHRTRRPLSPHDLHCTIAKSGAAINVVTVYRILAAFEELGLVHKHPCNGQYSLCSMPHHKGHHGFLHCHDCGSVEEFHDVSLCKIEDRIAKSAKFRPKVHVSEIVGVCKFCR